MSGRREKAKTPDRFQQSRWMDLVQQREFETPPQEAPFWDKESVAAVFTGLVLGVLLGVPLGTYLWMSLTH